MHPVIQAQLRSLGVDTSKPGKMVCPECGERKLSAAAKKPAAKCWGCGFVPSSRSKRDHMTYAAIDIIETIARQCADALKDLADDHVSAYRYLTQVRKLPESFSWYKANDVLALDTRKIDLAEIRSSATSAVRYAKARDLAEAPANKKQRAALTKRWEALEADLELFLKDGLSILTSNHFQGAVIFLYRDEHNQPISLKLRQHRLEIIETAEGLKKKPKDQTSRPDIDDDVDEDEDGNPIFVPSKPRERAFVTIQPMPGRRGVFDAGLVLGYDWPDASDMNPIVVEGEFNRLSLVAAGEKWSRQTGKDYCVPGFALGGKTGADYRTTLKLTEGVDWLIWHDNEPRAKGEDACADPKGFSLVVDFAERASVRYFSSDEKDADDWAHSDSASPEALLDLVNDHFILYRPLESVRREIDSIRMSGWIAFECRRSVVRLVLDDLVMRGKFYDAGCIVYVRIDEEANTSIVTRFLTGDRRFEALLEKYGITPTDKDLIRDLQSAAYTRAIDDSGFAPRTTMHALAHTQGSHHYVNTFDGRFIRISETGECKPLPNGTDGVIFKEMENVEPWTFPNDFDPDGRFKVRPDQYLTRYVLNSVNFDGSRIASYDAQQLIKAWILSLYFPAEHSTTMHLTFSGAPGSGKTTIGENIGRVVCGSQFEAIQMPDNAKELVENAAAAPLAVLDEWHTTSKGNAEVDAKLKKLATSKHESRRQYYTTMDMIEFEADAALILTTEGLPTGDPALIQRLLMFHALPRQSQSGEEAFESKRKIKAEINRFRPHILKELAATIVGIHILLQKLSEEDRDAIGKSANRMADFAIFLRTIADAEGWEPEAKRMLAALQDSQTEQAAGAMRLIGLFRDLFAAMPDCSGQTKSASEWCKVLAANVPQHDRESLSMLNSKSFGKQIARYPVIRDTLRIAITEDSHSKVRLYTIQAEGALNSDKTTASDEVRRCTSQFNEAFRDEFEEDFDFSNRSETDATVQ